MTHQATGGVKGTLLVGAIGVCVGLLCHAVAMAYDEESSAPRAPSAARSSTKTPKAVTSRNLSLEQNIQLILENQQKILENQEKIFQKLDEVMEELRITKIRALH